MCETCGCGDPEIVPVEVQERILSDNDAQAEPSWPSQGQLPVNIDKTLLDHDAPDDEYIYWPN